MKAEHARAISSSVQIQDDIVNEQKAQEEGKRILKRIYKEIETRANQGLFSYDFFIEIDYKTTAYSYRAHLLVAEELRAQGYEVIYDRKVHFFNYSIKW